MAQTLTEVFQLNGTALTASANEPLPVIDPGAVWLVTNGHIDVVAMTIMRNESGSDLQRTHLLRIPAGQLIFGARPPKAGQNVLLLGFGSADAAVSRLSLASLAELVDHAAEGGAAGIGPEMVSLVDKWVMQVCTLCNTEATPEGTQNLRAGSKLALAAGQCAQPQSGVLWLRTIAGSVRFMSKDGPCAFSPDLLFPVSKDAWVCAETDCFVGGVPGDKVVVNEAFWKGLEAFGESVQTLVDVQRMRDVHRDRLRLVAKREATRTTLSGAFGALESILHERPTVTSVGTDGEGALLAACRLVGDRLGIEIRPPETTERKRGDANPLELIARNSKVTVREVRLQGEWWRRDGGPILGFAGGGEKPLAILPTGPMAYEVHDLTSGSVRKVTKAVAGGIDPVAFTFYRSLPERSLSGLDLFKFATFGVGRDVVTVALMGAIGGLLAMVTPLATGMIFDTIVPSSDRSQLMQIVLGLMVAAFAAAAFQITRNVALTRVQHRAGSALQAALWHRLINLPVKFFTNYSSGDLSTRAMGIDTIMTELSTSAITTIVSTIFSLFSLSLLFYYSPSAAVVAVGMISVLVVAIIITGLVQSRYQKQLEEMNGKMASLLLQFMNGIAKIRVAAAEDRAFGQWAAAFSQQTRTELKSRRVQMNLSVFGAAFPLLTYMVIYMTIAREVGGTVTTGSFLGFIAAYTGLLTGMIEVGYTVVGLLNIVPIYQRLKPILKESPEISTSKVNPGTLRGGIEVTNVSFRYTPDGPLILDRVCLHAEPGEFVAIVGGSGSGKSTLFRILLGFEQPESGTVAFDGFDASGLDPQGLRRQIGVVLQNGDLLPGDIFSNIVGSSVDLTHEDAWEAARAAGLDKDIEQMPMGMHTIIAEGAGTLSGGQKQRLMIARSLVTKPRIVFFDEATSALDNPTQKIVTQSLDRLRATRLVIAHRLSTIENADKIYVVERGRVVQSGAYEELVSNPGPFYELVKRQIA